MQQFSPTSTETFLCPPWVFNKSPLFLFSFFLSPFLPSPESQFYTANCIICTLISHPKRRKSYCTALAPIVLLHDQLAFSQLQYFGSHLLRFFWWDCSARGVSRHTVAHWQFADPSEVGTYGAAHDTFIFARTSWPSTRPLKMDPIFRSIFVTVGDPTGPNGEISCAQPTPPHTQPLHYYYKNKNKLAWSRREHRNARNF